MERGAKSAKAKITSRRPAARKPRQVAAPTTLQLKQRLAEALEQHAAISKILQVISASPSDVQPVLDTVAERAAHLCEAPLARVLLVDGDILRAMAEYSLDGDRWMAIYPKDGIADSRAEQYELTLDGDAASRAVVIRATDALNNVMSARAEAPPAPAARR